MEEAEAEDIRAGARDIMEDYEDYLVTSRNNTSTSSSVGETA